MLIVKAVELCIHQVHKLGCINNHWK